MLGVTAAAGPWCAPLSATQEPPPAVLTTPEARFAKPLSLVRSLRELPDGRVLVIDWFEERVAVLDFETGAQHDIGRSGAGPREYRLPASLVAVSGDSTLLVDWGNNRLSLVGPDLRITGSVERPADLRALTSVRGADRRGGIYLTIPPWARGFVQPGGDSVVIARWDRRSDTIARVAVIKGSTRPDRSGPRTTPGLPFVPFARQDGWVVHPDGGVVVVRAGGYRVERVRADGEVRHGPRYPSADLLVTRGDKEAFVRRFNARTPISGRGPDGGLGHLPSSFNTAEQIAATIRSNEFASVHPPFVAGGVWLAPEGELWVEQPAHAGTPQSFDRFDERGVRVGRVTLPAGRRLVGMGRGVLYAVVADEMDLQRLERYRR